MVTYIPPLTASLPMAESYHTLTAFSSSVYLPHVDEAAVMASLISWTVVDMIVCRWKNSRFFGRVMLQLISVS